VCVCVCVCVCVLAHVSAYVFMYMCVTYAFGGHFKEQTAIFEIGCLQITKYVGLCFALMYAH